MNSAIIRTASSGPEFKGQNDGDLAVWRAATNRWHAEAAPSAVPIHYAQLRVPASFSPPTLNTPFLQSEPVAAGAIASVPIPLDVRQINISSLFEVDDVETGPFRWRGPAAVGYIAWQIGVKPSIIADTQVFWGSRFVGQPAPNGMALMDINVLNAFDLVFYSGSSPFNPIDGTEVWPGMRVFGEGIGGPDGAAFGYTELNWQINILKLL